MVIVTAIAQPKLRPGLQLILPSTISLRLSLIPLWSIFALNSSAAGLWMLTTKGSAHTALLRWGERIIALFCLLIITGLAIGYVNSWNNSDALTLPVWLGFSLLWLYRYRLRQLELTMLSAWALAAIILAVIILSRGACRQYRH